MSERNRRNIIYVLLIAAILYGVYSFTLGKKVAHSEQPGTPTSPVPASVQPGLEAAPDLTAIEAQPWGRDPFGSRKIYSVAPRTTSLGSVRPVWTLSGVVYNERHPMAFISGVAVGVGDTVNQARVIQIGKNKVTLEYNGSRFDIFVTRG